MKKVQASFDAEEVRAWASEEGRQAIEKILKMSAAKSRELKRSQSMPGPRGRIRR